MKSEITISNITYDLFYLYEKDGFTYYCFGDKSNNDYNVNFIKSNDDKTFVNLTKEEKIYMKEILKELDKEGKIR